MEARFAAAPLATPAARRARARILELSRGGVADQAFLEELSAQLRTIVPFEGAFWAGADPLTALATSPARLESLADVPDMCTIWWECEFLVQDLLPFRDLARAARPTGSLHRASFGCPARSLRYRAVNEALGYSDELRAVFRTGGGAWGLVSLWRGEGDAPFSIAEEKLLADLAGPLAEPFRRASLLREDPAADSLDAPGILMFDRAGALESLNEPAEAWLAGLSHPVVTGEPRELVLPTELLTVSARARAIGAGLDRGVARARIQQAGRWLVVHGFMLRGADGGDGRTVLVIEPARPSEIAPIIASAYGLTLREQEITQMLSRGLSTDHICSRLYLSKHTVRGYIKQVFEKAGVSSRGELVSKLFAEHYSHPLHNTIDTVASN